MSDRDTKWRFDTVDRDLKRLDQHLDGLDRRLDNLFNILREMRADVATLERTIVRGHGERIARLENRLMTPANSGKETK